MSGFRNPIIGGGGGLVYPSIKSPKFTQTPLSGWSINKSGDAYFGSVTLAGTFSGLRFEINADGMFFYDGTPAAGSLAASIAPAAGTDAYGNAYLAGQASYTQSGSGWLASAADAATVTFYTAASAAGPWAVSASIEYSQATPGGLVLRSGADIVIEPEDTAGYVLTSSGGTVESLTAWEPGSSPPAAETWHDIAADLATGWSVGTARYQLLATGRVICEIVNLVPPSTKPSDGTAIWPAGTIPSGWAPAGYPPITVTYHSGSAGSETPALQARPNGSIEVYGVGSTSVTRMDALLKWSLN